MVRILGLMAGFLIIVSTAAGQSVRVSFSAKDRHTAAVVSLDSVRIEKLSTMRDTVIKDPFVIELEISTEVQDRLPGLVRSLEISGNFANPFTDATSFTVTTETRGSVQLELFSITGRREADLNTELEAGAHHFSLEAASLPAGVYLLVARAGQTSSSVRIVKNGAAGGGSALFLHMGWSSSRDAGVLRKKTADLYRFTGYADTYYPEPVTAAPSQDTAIVFEMRRIEIASITIGTQVWMLKNLDVDKYRNGDPIPQVTDPAQWASLTTGAWCYYTNKPTMGFGKLYNWYAVNDPRGLAPAGWHVPSDTEWTVLTTYLGAASVAGGKLKEAGTSHWRSPNNGADNSSGFTAFPAGYRNYNGTFNGVGDYGFWWSSSEYSASSAWYRDLTYHYANVYRGTTHKSYGFSVRCVRD